MNQLPTPNTKVDLRGFNAWLVAVIGAVVIALPSLAVLMLELEQFFWFNLLLVVFVIFILVVTAGVAKVFCSQDYKGEYEPPDLIKNVAKEAARRAVDDYRRLDR